MGSLKQWTNELNDFKMKLLLLISFILPSDSLLPSWETTLIDPWLSVELPADYEKSDTLGMSLWIAAGEYSNILVTKVPVSSIDELDRLTVFSVVDLKEFYNGVEKGTIREAGGKVVESKEISVGNLAGRYFTIDMENDEVRIAQAILVQDVLYTGMVWFYSDNYDLVQREKDKFFSSFEFSISKADQLQKPQSQDSNAYKLGWVLGKIAVFLVVLGILTLLIMGIRKLVLAVTK